jgi:hypothetical protein
MKANNLLRGYRSEESLSLEEKIRKSKEELEINNALFNYGEMVEELKSKIIKIKYQKLADYYLKFVELKKNYYLEFYEKEEKNNNIKMELKGFKKELNEYGKKVITAITSIYNSSKDNYSKVLMFDQLLKIYFKERREDIHPLLLRYAFEIRNIIEGIKNSKTEKKIRELNRIQNLIDNLL